MVIDAVAARTSKLAYGHALDQLFAFAAGRHLSRALQSEEAARLTAVPNIRERGTRLGNWLTKEQAKELLTVPDRSTLKGKRDYAILALLVGCALRRRELASLNVGEIQLPENR